MAVDMSELEVSCGLMPAQDNPYSAHAMPLQIAQQMEREGRLRAASLAYEAAVRVSLTLYSFDQPISTSVQAANTISEAQALS